MIEMKSSGQLSSAQTATLRDLGFGFGVFNSVITGMELCLLMWRRAYRYPHQQLVLFHFIAMFFYLLFTEVILGYTLFSVDISTPALCTTLGFLQQFTQSLFMLWEVCLIIHQYFLFLWSPLDQPINLTAYHLLVWPASFFFSFLPMTTLDYDPRSGCWISDSPMGLTWRVLTSYIPSLIYFSIIILSYLLIFRHHALASRNLTQVIDNREKRPLRFLILYPLLFTLFYLPSVISGLYTVATHGVINFDLAVANIICQGLYALVAVLIEEWVRIRPILEKIRMKIIGDRTSSSTEYL